MSEKTTRDEIVAAADLLFYRKGYEHTSFADIADVVKISAEISIFTSNPRIRSLMP